VLGHQNENQKVLFKVIYFSAWLFMHEHFLNVFRIFLEYVLKVHEYFICVLSLFA
jgi:hypothetical protein